MTPPTDIVICVRATREFPMEGYFEKCVDTLTATTHNFRLLIVDDNSDLEGANVVARVASRFPGAKLIRTYFQHWFTKAYNLGLRLARTPRVVLLNADTELGAGWLEELYDVWEDFERSSGRRVGLVGSVFSGDEQRRYIETVRPGYTTGHAWLVSMQALYDVSARRGQPGIYLDETSPLNIHIRSDVELCWTMNDIGWATITSFKSAVGHHGGKSWGHNVARVQCLTLEEVAEKWQP